MSDTDKVKDKQGISSFIRSGGKITPPQLLDKYIGNVKEYTTEINNPVAFSLFETLSLINRKRGYVNIADVYDHLAERLRVNMIAFKRKRSTEFKDALVSVMVEEIHKNQDKVDSLIQKRGRR